MKKDLKNSKLTTLFATLDIANHNQARKKNGGPHANIKIQLFTGAHPSHNSQNSLVTRTVEYLHFFMEKWLKHFESIKILKFALDILGIGMNAAKTEKKWGVPVLIIE